eukprot:Phypoly_transcript_08898.p1 GENE.Phypoly_transcript_08898~~Phypoly_transcript_08898.p1  ORF type:complete len:309 (-),score=50.52 Phypoly_transcript_08898:243-1169(-)
MIKISLSSTGTEISEKTPMETEKRMEGRKVDTGNTEIIYRELVRQQKEEQKGVDPTNVFVKFLPSDFVDKDLHDLFSPFGTIISAKVMIDHKTGYSLGFGFVKFSNEEEASMAVYKMAGHRIENKNLLCKLSNICHFASPSPSLYIKPLPPTCTEEILLDLFKEYGEIQTLKIVRDHNKPYDVVGLVRYQNAESAGKAMQRTSGTALLPDWRPVTVAYAESDAQRAKRKANRVPPAHTRSLESPLESPIWQEAAESSYTTAPIHHYAYEPYEYFPQYYVPLVYYPASEVSLFGWYNSYHNAIYPSFSS